MPNRGIRVESMGGGGWLVKGTTDVDTARQALIDEGSATHVDGLEVADTRWFRIVPAYPHDPCGLDHTHHLVPDKENRRGAFPAVIFATKRVAQPGVTRQPSRRASKRRWA